MRPSPDRGQEEEEPTPDGRSALAGPRVDWTDISSPDALESAAPTDAELDALIAASIDVVFVLDRDGRYLKAASTGRRSTHQPVSAMAGRKLTDVLPPGEARRFLAVIRKALDTGEVQQVEYQLTVGDDQVWFSGSVGPTAEGTVVWITRDVTDQRRLEAALVASEGNHRDLLAALPVIVYSVAPEPPYAPTYVSPGVALLGYTLEEWMAEPDMWLRSLHPEDRERIVLETHEALASGNPIEYEYRILTKDGRERWVHDRGAFVRDTSGHAIEWRGVIMDITERRALEAQLAALTEEDDLTGLLNRRGFRRMAEQALKIERRSGRSVALLYLDLDDFKGINDTYGHAAGDAVLQDVAERLLACLRVGDLAARLGGDEFVVMALGMTGSGDGVLVANRLRRGLEGPIEGYESPPLLPVVTCSIGVAELEAGEELDALLARADQALYEAKRKRRPSQRG
jgi:diguanylate cyclase (GGDEF)-like protein/PAS domain S-box-containing protein